MRSLAELAEFWGTDKALHYAPFYASMFEHRRREVFKVLEVGIGYPEIMGEQMVKMGRSKYVIGASLFMWRDYFPAAEIFALDNNPAALDGVKDRMHIKAFWCDQSMGSTYPLAELGTDFDLIIDDGSHFPDDQITCAQILVPLLADKGIYVIEDAPPYNGDFVERVWNQVSRSFEVQDFGDDNQTRLLWMAK